MAQEETARSSDTKPLSNVFPQCNSSNETPRIRWLCATLARKYQSCCYSGTVHRLKGPIRVSQRRCKAWGQVCALQQKDTAQTAAADKQAKMGLRGARRLTERPKALSFSRCPCGRATCFRGVVLPTIKSDRRANTRPGAASDERDRR